MMGEYISRDAVLIVLDWDCASQDALNAIKAIPAADVAPVVRCYECKHYNAGFECLIEGYGIERPADYFCADGERKEGGQDE